MQVTGPKLGSSETALGRVLLSSILVQSKGAFLWKAHTSAAEL